MPPLTAILTTIYLCEQLEKSMILALLIAMCDLGFLAAEDLDLLIKNPVGPIIMLFKALCWAIGNVGMKSRTWTLKTSAADYMVCCIFQCCDMASGFNLGANMETELA